MICTCGWRGRERGSNVGFIGRYSLTKGRRITKVCMLTGSWKGKRCAWHLTETILLISFCIEWYGFNVRVRINGILKVELSDGKVGEQELYRMFYHAIENKFREAWNWPHNGRSFFELQETCTVYIVHCLLEMLTLSPNI